jgi:hypothetical protein
MRHSRSRAVPPRKPMLRKRKTPPGRNRQTTFLVLLLAHCGAANPGCSRLSSRLGHAGKRVLRQDCLPHQANLEHIPQLLTCSRIAKSPGFHACATM